jgi:hypothetical protein
MDENPFPQKGAKRLPGFTSLEIMKIVGQVAGYPALLLLKY